MLPDSLVASCRNARPERKEIPQPYSTNGPRVRCLVPQMDASLIGLQAEAAAGYGYDMQQLQDPADHMGPAYDDMHNERGRPRGLPLPTFCLPCCCQTRQV